MTTQSQFQVCTPGLTRKSALMQRVEDFNQMLAGAKVTFMRCVTSAPDREVVIEDPFTGRERKMLMFASNNYLGLANHPYVKNRVKKAIDAYGTGIGGPPLLNGYIKLIREAEERLADLKGQKAAMVFSSGFMANMGVMSGLVKNDDIILYDELSHASLHDGIRLSKANAIKFAHNNIQELESALIQFSQNLTGNIFVCVEGVYSMDGDIGRLDKIAPLCQKYGAMLIVDDAHGTGVIGEKGKGTASHLHCSKEVDLTMGTFSKVFATCGGFLAGSSDMIQYLRFHARSYIFSASIPPPVAASVLGGIEVMENEPWRRLKLLENVKHAAAMLSGIEFCAAPEAAIITLKLPEGMVLRKAAYLLHQKNIFMNAIEFPAVAADAERFRLSFMSSHTPEDINRLAEAVNEVWNDPQVYSA